MKLSIGLLRETHHGLDLVKVRHTDRISLFKTHCQQCSSVKAQPLRLENRTNGRFWRLADIRADRSECPLVTQSGHPGELERGDRQTAERQYPVGSDRT
jgi:hypothetical protein